MGTCTRNCAGKLLRWRAKDSDHLPMGSQWLISFIVQEKKCVLTQGLYWIKKILSHTFNHLTIIFTLVSS